MDKSDKPQPGPRLATGLPEAGLFVDLGSQRQDEIERFKSGDGVLTQCIQSTIEEWSKELGVDCNVEVVPVVLLYRHSRPA
jgi:hypothetical protein